MLKKSLFLLAGAFLSFTSSAQITINPAPTPTDLVTNTLIGPGLTTSNITFTGFQSQIGYFDGSASTLGLPDGVVMSSGNVTSIVPTGFPDTDLGGAGDADVLATAQSVTSNPAGGMNITSTNDAAVLEFDFVPDGDQVVFNFVFASEEYLTYVNTVYNDAFGFYLSGPNPAGGNYASDNFALVPGTTEPITISTIHPGLNAGYYIDNAGNNTHSFNGFTVPIEIRFDVICGQTYHFKFAVADCVDGILDTGVFLEGGSFQSIPVDMTFATSSGDTTIYEGCNAFADLTFTRPVCQSADSLVADVVYSGTAQNGVDYTFMADSVLFLPGQDTVVLQLEPLIDGTFEGPESITITVTSILSNGDTIVTVATGWILDEPDLEVIANDTTVYCRQDSSWVNLSSSGGIQPHSYVWSTGDTTNFTYVDATTNGSFEYYVTVTDFCGFTDTDTLTFIVDQTLTIDSLLTGPASACTPTGWASAYVSGITDALNQPLYNWTGPGNPGANSIDGTVITDVPSGWYYFTVEDDVCIETDSAFIDIINPPIAGIVATPLEGCAPLTVNFTNTSQNSTTYEWDFGGGNIVNANSLAGQTQVFTSSQIVQLVAFDAAMCSDTFIVAISVTPCGCTDPLATNYNPMASIEDGSCIYPTPIVIAPNVFTPNEDGDNDLFELDHQFALEIDLYILNRWGNVMYETTGTNPIWDGNTASDVNAEDGTYFYKYVARGAGEDSEIEGHGFVQLIRK